MKFKLIPFLLLASCLGFLSLNAQSLKKVMHMHGTKTIHGVHVKVTCVGSVDSLDYCDGEASPYFVGYNPNTSSSGNGRVNFHFSKPITEVVLNFAGTSDIDNHYEEVIIYVNGKHYRLSAPGKKHECEELAKINERGNLVGCRDCSVSGWSGTRIKGPITSLTIIDTIIRGEPNGTVFSLFMGPEIPIPDTIALANTLDHYKQTITEEAAGKSLTIESNQLENSEIVIKDKLGNFVPITYQLIESNKVIIDISDFPKGEYLIEIKLDGVIESQKFLIK